MYIYVCIYIYIYIYALGSFGSDGGVTSASLSSTGNRHTRMATYGKG